jgi:hypothetical protein
LKNSTIAFAMVMVLTAMIFDVSPAKATDISGTIVNTVIITQDSRLTGDVICNVVVGTPCIFFAAPRIELKMNGHTMTGKGARDVCAAPVFGEYAISTNGQNRVSIEGPGLITNFRDISVFVTGDDTEVEGVTIVSGCTEGIHLEGSHNTAIDNTVVRASLDGNFWAGIFVSGSGMHVVRHNEVVAAGPDAHGAVSPGFGGGHGIIVGSANFCSGVPTKNNLIEGNNLSGNNGEGILLVSATLAPTYCFNTTGNVIRNNIIFGNTSYFDIYDYNTAGSNAFESNSCEVSGGPGATGVCPKVTKNSGHQNPIEELFGRF